MNQAAIIIGKFGGINAMAAKLGHRNSSTVQGWYERGVIPPRRYPEILCAGQDLVSPLVAEDFVRHLAEDRRPEPIPLSSEGLPARAME